MRKFKFRCKEFSGFICNIDVNQHEHTDTILNEAIIILNTILVENGMKTLSKRLKKINYRIYYSIETIKDEGNKNKIFYICGYEDIINLII